MANLTLRSVKGSALTNEELDGNFEYFTGSLNGELSKNPNTQSLSLTVSSSYNALLIGPIFNSGSITIQPEARLVIL
jgi:hypothetical protein